MSFFDDDIEQLYRGWLGVPAHPSSPCGGGGTGGFRQAGPLGVGSNCGFSSLPHPDSPAGRRLTPEDITKALNSKKLAAENQSSHNSIDDRKKTRLDENKKYLKNANVKAFLNAIAAAEGGDYNLKYGGVKGKKNDKWQFSDFSTHPGAGYGGINTPAGMYQITIGTWRKLGEKLGLTDFSPTTQDLMAIEILRGLSAIDNIVEGHLDVAVSKASSQWNALPQGPGKTNKVTNQPYMEYDDFVKAYNTSGGIVK